MTVVKMFRKKAVQMVSALLDQNLEFEHLKLVADETAISDELMTQVDAFMAESEERIKELLVFAAFCLEPNQSEDVLRIHFMQIAIRVQKLNDYVLKIVETEQNKIDAAFFEIIDEKWSGN